MKFALIFIALASLSARADQRALTEDEIAKAKVWVGADQLVVAQSFATKFVNLGDVWFLSTTEPPPKSFVYRIYKDDKELTRFEPSHELCPWSSFDLKDVVIEDFDGDGREDVGVIAQYLTGAGPEGAKPFSVAEMYINDGKGGFVHDVDMHKRLSMSKVGNRKDLMHFARKPEKEKVEKKKKSAPKIAPAKREKK